MAKKERTSTGKSVDTSKWTAEKNKKTLDYRKGKGRIKVTKKGKVIKGAKDKKQVGGYNQVGSKVAGSGGTRGVKKGYTSSGRATGSSDRVIKEKKANRIKKRGTVKGSGPKASLNLKSWNKKKK